MPDADDKVLRQEAVELLKRFDVENDLMVKRTAAVLTLNGLMAAAVAAGDRLPPALKFLVAILMILLNLAWLYRSGAARGFMSTLTSTAYGPRYDHVLPADARIHKGRHGGKAAAWLSTANVFSIGVPFGLVVCWLGGIITVQLFGMPGMTGRYQVVPGATPVAGEVLVLDTQTGQVTHRPVGAGK